MRPFRLALLLLLAQSLVAELPLPPKPTAWVTDNANILSPDQEQSLNEKLEAVKQRTGTEMLVMTFPSLEGEELVDYTNRVANLWETKDDKALMLFVFVNDRQTFTQVGYELEGVLPDVIVKRIYADILVPNFRQQKYYEGIDEALNQYVMRIDPNALQNIPQRPPSSQPVRREEAEGGIPFEAIIFIAFIVLFFILPMFTRRRSGCSGCIVPFWFGGGGFGGGGTTFGGGGGGGWSTGGSWGGGGSSFGGGGAGGGW